MARLRYNHPVDNLAALATITFSGLTPVSAIYGAANLQILNPALPFKANEKTGRVIYDFGTAMPVALPALIHHNFDAGLSVKWQAHATDTWGAPSFSQAFTIAAKDTDGYRPNSYLDLSGGVPNYRYHSLFIEGTNTTNLIFAAPWLGTTVRTLTHNYSDGFRRDDERPGRNEWTTKAGVRWVYPSIGRQRRLDGEVETVDAGIVLLSTWSQAAGGLDQPTLIVPDAPDITDAILGHLLYDFGYSHIPVGSGRVPFGFLELARGVPWP